MERLFLLSLLFAASVAQLSYCDPLDPSRCYLPFPNNFWLRQDSSGKTHLTFDDDTFPVSDRGYHVDPQAGGYNDLDGFSPIMPITTYVGTVNLTFVPKYWNVPMSLDPNCPTMLLDTSTGEIVPHWAELDYSAINERTREQMFMMWPASRLKDQTRYIVALRFLVNNVTGLPVKPSEAFLALRDNIPTNNPDIEERRALFADIFSQLEKVGWERSTLQLAWDFTTGTLDTLSSRLLSMRKDALSRIPADGIGWKVLKVTENPSQYIRRKIEGLVSVPYYVNSQFPGAELVLDSNGTPVFQGFGQASFAVLIPNSLVDNSTGNGIVGSIAAFGHGLFETKEEVTKDYNEYQANANGWVLIAVDWIGMTAEDVPFVVDMVLTNLTNFKMIPDRLHQAHINAIFAMKLMREGYFAKDPNMVFNGYPVISPASPCYYFGNSNGGIQGSVYMAYSLDVMRGMLGVGGGPYALLLPRASPFAAFYDILKVEYNTSLDRIFLISAMQLLWSRVDPGGYMSHVTSDPLPDTPAKEILLQHGLGDAEVTYVGVYAMARSMGASMFASNVHEPNEALYGFTFIPDNSVGTKALCQTWRFPGVAPSPEINIPANTTTDTHQWSRRQQDAMDQMYHFFVTGEILNYCNGSCEGVYCDTPPCGQ